MSWDALLLPNLIAVKLLATWEAWKLTGELLESYNRKVGRALKRAPFLVWSLGEWYGHTTCLYFCFIEADGPSPWCTALESRACLTVKISNLKITIILFVRRFGTTVTDKSLAVQSCHKHIWWNSSQPKHPSTWPSPLSLTWLPFELIGSQQMAEWTWGKRQTRSWSVLSLST